MRFIVSVAVAGLVLALVAPVALAAPSIFDCGLGDFLCAGQWRFAGQNIANTHAQPDETRIKVGNVGSLQPRWTFTTNPSLTTFPSSDVSATPTVAGDTEYVPDWGGWLYALDARTGKTRWVHKISEYNGVAGTFSRSSPAVVGDLLILGDKPPSGVTGWGQGSGQGAHVMAVNARTGELVWITQVDANFASQITASPLIG